jgi:hypothetical protein
MRRIFIAAFLLTGGCNALNSEQNASSGTTASTVDLLKQGAAQACSQQDVRDTVLSMIKPKDTDRGGYELGDFKEGLSLVSYNIDTIALAAVDKSINSVSCDGNIVVHYKDHEDKTYTIRYVVRPSVEDASSFVVNVSAPDAAEYAINAARDAASNIVSARYRTQQETEQASADPEATAPATGPNNEQEPVESNDEENDAFPRGNQM